MYVLRLGSLNRLEQELRRKGRWERLTGPRKPGADTIGRVLSQINCDDIRRLLAGANRTAWRSKSIHMDKSACNKAARESYRVVAVDGHELFSGKSRCCAQCSTREVKDGDKLVVQYYHRVVVAQWVGVTPPGILDLEMVKPGEGEVVAARRLVQRVFASYSRLVDVITADAIYLEAPFIKLALKAGKHVVIVMKQENRDLFEDADRLRKLIEPRVIRDNGKTTRLWDMSNLTSFTTLDSQVRVIWAEESSIKRRRVGGQWREQSCESTWVWVTDLPASSVPAPKIQKWGHDRWDIENRAFNELAAHWHADHCYKHNINAIEALLLILALAFLFTYLFYERNLKPESRRYLTRFALAARFMEGFAQPDDTTLWASLRPG